MSAAGTIQPSAAKRGGMYKAVLRFNPGTYYVRVEYQPAGCGYLTRQDALDAATEWAEDEARLHNPPPLILPPSRRGR